MPDRNTPTELKGGRGFDFEDFVAACYLSEILVGGTPLSADCGVVTRIDWQVPEDEWHLDDILLTFDRGDGVTPRCACSIKGNKQFTSKRAPPDFVRNCWRQFLRVESSAFDPNRDFLALFTGPQPAQISRSLQQILVKARAKDSETLLQEFSGAGRIAKTTKELFFSFRCPGDVCENEQIDDNQIGRLLKRIVVRDYDFLDVASRSVDHALSECRDALDSGQIADAQRLWQDLLILAKRHRSPGGLLDRATVVAALRSKHRLKGYPWHDADWARLDRWTHDRVNAIPCKIGNSVSLERRDALERLENNFQENRCVVLVGASGVGKTVLARHWATAQVRKRVLWIDAGTLARTDWGAVESQLRLDHSLANLLAGMSDSEALIVLDGMENLVSSEAFSRLAVLFRWAGMRNPASPWRILGTCVTDQWHRVQNRLVRTDIPGNEFQECAVEALKGQDIKAVWEEFPSLRRLTLTPHLGPLLRLPKVLDLLATNVRSGTEVNTSQWVGESDLIRWFWQEKVEDTKSAAQRSACLQDLALFQADRGEHRISITDLSDWARVIDQLVEDRLCHFADGRVGFQHDLFADWARQRVILGKGAETRDFLEPRSTKPHWHRAIRLYGLDLLEQHDGLEQWRTAFQQLPFAQDLLLEAAVYASNPSEALERLRGELMANGGGLLRRLLGRFLHVASTPMTENPEELSDISVTSRAWIRATHRRPYPMLWFPVLRWLHQHRDEVVDVAPLEVAKITGMWLEKVPTNWLLCRDAAELAITIGEQAYRSRLARPYGDDKDDQTKYRAALLAATELPDRVTEFARKACGRDVPEEVLAGEVGDYRPPGTRLEREGALSQFTITVPNPWPDGPRCSVDTAFRDACLEADSLQPIMECRPGVAREILLASVIEYRISDHSGNLGDSMLDIDGIEEIHFFSPPVYFRGPFLPFLQRDPKEAIETIVRLVNFAAERWAQQVERSRYATAIVHHVSIGEGHHPCVGNGEVFHWHRGFMCRSNTVVAALVALEKWLYNKLEAGESVNHEIAQILATSRSVAFAGLLIEVGKSQPALFQGALRDLLVVPEFYAWEVEYRTHGYDHFGPPLETRFGEWFFDLQKKWAALPHRERHLVGVATELYGKDPAVHEQLCSARDAWLARRASEENELIATILDQLCVTFNSENWGNGTDADGNEVLVFHPPQAPRSENTAPSDNSDQRVANCIRFAMGCRQRLDNRQPLPEDTIDKFWDFLSRLADEDSGEESTEDEHRRRDALCGGAAVLLLLHEAWLAEHPERYQFCLGTLVEATCDPPTGSLPDVPESIVDYQWDHFCAEVAPRIWADDPDSPEIRRWVVTLATSFHYRTVGILMESAFHFRDRLKAGFGQLQHFVLRAAAARWEATSEIRTHFQKTAFDYRAWWDEYAVAFIENRIEPTTPPWNSLWLSKPPLWYARNRHGHDEHAYAYIPPIDGIMVQHAFQWIRSLDDAKDENEQRQWIAFWREAVRCSLSLTTCYDRDGRLIDDPDCDAGLPHKFDEWVLESVADIVPQIEDDEVARELWEPIITLGRFGTHWVDRFLWQWIRNVLRCTTPGRLVDRWRSMSALARSLSAWTDHRRGWGRRSDELPSNLLGVGQLMADLWEPRHAEIAAQLRDEFRHWKDCLLADSYVAIHFVRWLARPAAEPLLLEGLPWIRDRADRAGKHWCNNEYLPDQVANLLVHCWGSYRQELLKDPTAYVAFGELLKTLADTQHCVAMDLQDQIAEEG